MADASITVTQIPAAGSRRVKYVGATMKIALELSEGLRGSAFVRTNLGHFKEFRKEILEFFKTERRPLGRDWSDIPMRKVSNTRYEVVLPLHEPGHFEFKTYFQCADAEQTTYWTKGENAILKVDPAANYANNGIYNAFIRQFGKNISKTEKRQDLEDAEALLNKENYTVVPPSGTFRDLKEHLDFIIDKMGFRIIQLLPVHPTPLAYGRMGRFGSPFAPLDFMAVDSSMADFDRSSTPMAQFEELVDEIHARSADVYLDLPADHTGWASVLQSNHPEWFRRNGDGSFESPGAWGNVWADLVKLDFDKRPLWDYLSEVFLYWCTLGVDGFRCDAGYMIPAPAWTYIIAKVRNQFPDTIFFLEGLGGGIDATARLLTTSGMNWAYSELFQNYSRDEVSGYLQHAVEFSQNCGTLVHFAETHDNDRLAKVSKHWAKMRTAMAALFAPAGCYGIANGVEWYATEKIDVHSDCSLNWGAKENMVDFIAKINNMLANHPAFGGAAKLKIPVGAGGSAVGLLRRAPEEEDTVLAIVNPNPNEAAVYEWNFQEFAPNKNMAFDLIREQMVPVMIDQCSCRVRVEPGQALCLAYKPMTVRPNGLTMVQWQLLRSTVLRIIVDNFGYSDLEDLNIDHLVEMLYENPVDFIKAVQTHKQGYLPIVEWYAQRDEFKTTPIPPGHELLIYSDKPFRAGIYVNDVCRYRLQSCRRSNGRYFALVSPAAAYKEMQPAELRMSVFDGVCAHRTSAQLMLLPTLTEMPQINYALQGDTLLSSGCALSTSNLGGYSQNCCVWGDLHSKYDALLAANLNPEMPVDRRIIIPNCRVQIRHRGFIQEVNRDCQTDFAILPSGAMRWNFVVPTGMGQNIYLSIVSKLDRKSGNLTLAFCRLQPPADDKFALPASVSVNLIVAPNLENRSQHDVTKASLGAEVAFPKAITADAKGFDFDLGNNQSLRMESLLAEYVTLPEWKYSQYYTIEAKRGLECTGDLYRPGYFWCQLKRGEICLVSAVIKQNGKAGNPASINPEDFTAPAESLSFDKALRKAIGDFVVDRSGLKTVIAGYPWFLDWGRDTLICLRGLLKAGFVEESADIITLFASYEEKGTIPNMICGNDISNRDTTDAPLWMILAVKEYISKTNDRAILERDCKGRTLLDVLKSIIQNYMSGTPNGIRMDKKSGLIYSPPHYTWMDTNYPACTPREGYPVEIQAMWIAVLNFLVEESDNEEIGKLAELAEKSLVTYFQAGKFVGLSDCLHTDGFQPAAEAVADDHCRPNQLFAITLGALKDKELCRHILQACQGLVVPGAIRTLADQPVKYALPLYKDGKLLNNPNNPYWGYYCGDEDTKRKPAYHNGTAWPWLMPSFCEALYMTYGESAKAAALSWLEAVAPIFATGCVGQISEIVDGNTPHKQGGCVAQAWSATEAYRVLQILK